MRELSGGELMRNAMICASVMLAMFLGWPLAFGGGHEAPRLAREVASIPLPAPADRERTGDAPRLLPAGISAPSGDVVRRPESCYSRFRRQNRSCSVAPSGASCRLKVADQWDICEATGFWPD